MVCVLAFDTALAGCSVGLWQGEGSSCPAAQHRETRRDQARILMPMIVDVLAEAGRTFNEIDLIVTTVGPGSFTGLRIGLSTARALGLALNKPVTGVSTLETMARQAQPVPGECILAVLETHRSDYYAQAFDTDGTPLGPPQALSGEKALNLAGNGPVLAIGDAVERLKAEISQTIVFRMQNCRALNPEILAKAGWEQYQADKNGSFPQPLYLREADVSFPKTPPRTIR